MFPSSGKRRARPHFTLKRDLESHLCEPSFAAPVHSGTGKTWAAKQLCYCTAAALLEDNAPNKVPILISAQALARMMRGAGAASSDTTGNLFHMYINSLRGSRKGAREMLLDAYNKRNVVLILDGLVSDSASY